MKRPGHTVGLPVVDSGRPGAQNIKILARDSQWKCPKSGPENFRVVFLGFTGTFPYEFQSQKLGSRPKPSNKKKFDSIARSVLEIFDFEVFRFLEVFCNFQENGWADTPETQDLGCTHGEEAIPEI